MITRELNLEQPMSACCRAGVETLIGTVVATGQGEARMNWEIKFYINTLSSKVGILKLRREFPGGLMVRALCTFLGVTQVCSLGRGN